MLTDHDRASGEASPSLRTQLAYLVGVAGLAFSVTLMFLEMRAVLDVGGSCADGGPYLSAQPCPDGTWLMFVAIFGGFGWGALALGAGSRLGGRFAMVPYLWWPALFCSLGFNFLQYGISSPISGDVGWGFLFPGVLFEVMGLVPLVLALRFGGTGDVASRERVRQAQIAAGIRVIETGTHAYPTLGEALAGTISTPGTPSGSLAGSPSGSLAGGSSGSLAASPSAWSFGTTGRDPVARDLAGELERLTDLHDRGALTDTEFATAKAALFAATKPRP